MWHELGQQDCSSKQSPGLFQDLQFSKGLFMAVYLLLHISLLVILKHFMFCSFAAHFQYNKRFPSSQDRGWDIRWWAKKYFWRNEQLSPRAEFQWMCSKDAVIRDMEEEVFGDIHSPRGGEFIWFCAAPGLRNRHHWSVNHFSYSRSFSVVNPTHSEALLPTEL